MWRTMHADPDTRPNGACTGAYLDESCLISTATQCRSLCMLTLSCQQGL